MTVTEKVALVTGASRRVGRGIAALARASENRKTHGADRSASTGKG